jgi:hypothetical protein
MFRRYNLPAEYPPLFKDCDSREKKLNCLLIQGDVSGFNAAAPLSCPFPAIEAARDEILELEDYLLEHSTEFRIGKVKRIAHDDGAAGSVRFVKALEKAFDEGTWDLVHYAGHSFGQSAPDGARVFLVFGPGEAGLVDGQTFARWVGKSRFLFLSSCQSAGAHFVLQMVKQTVPAIIGYRWKVEDLHAQLFARNFYASLFGAAVNNRYLEYAFLEAKRALHGSKLATPAWASPMLVMQSMEREPDRAW